MYIHINKSNGKQYVGITKQNPESRWRNGKGYKHCVAFYRAIQKYGWDGFEHVIFADKLTKSEAENMEQILISKLHTCDVDYGYNISEGGCAPLLSDETKKKIAQSKLGEKNPMFGKKHTSEQKEHLSKMFSGENNPNYGKKHSDETRKKISDALKGKHAHLTEEHKAYLSVIMHEKLKGRPRIKGSGKQPKPVKCIETGEVFESVADAARSKGIKNKSNISSSLHGRGKSCGGFHWEYYNNSSII